MGASDLVTAAAILAGATYLLYRSIWRKRGHCPGCPGGGCGEKAPLTRIGRARRSDS